MQQVAGHLQEKKGYFYAVLSFKDVNNKRKTKWIATGLPVKGNKKKAEAALSEIRRTFKVPTAAPTDASSMADMLFADYMIYWLGIIRQSVTLNTIAGYSTNIKSIIAPYFRELNVSLGDLQPKHIQDFYSERLKVVKPNSVIRYHANIRKALEYAVKMDYIAVNPIHKVEKPKKNSYIGSFYSVEEVERLFEVSKGTYLEVPVLLGAFYGFRRSEVVGLRWTAIDFEQNTITVNHTVTVAKIDGEKYIVPEDRAKNKSSLRTMPLVLPVKERLLALREQQKLYQKKFKGSYNKEYLDYICVDEIGNLIMPNYITSAFPTLLRKHNLRRIRFHDLRHTCASLLLKNGVSMKQIQEWLGHSDFSTTANIYSHLDYESKIMSANVMLEAFNLGEIAN